MRALIAVNGSAGRTGHNYLDEIVSAGSGIQPSLLDATIHHDDCCTMLQGTGPCNCEPAIEIQQVGGSELRFGQCDCEPELAPEVRQ